MATGAGAQEEPEQEVRREYRSETLTYGFALMALGEAEKEAAYVEAISDDRNHTVRTAGDIQRVDYAGIARGGADLADAIRFWAGEYGVSVALMDWLAQCESTYGTNPRAYDGSSGHYGAFQYNPGTWAGTPPGQRGESPNDDWAAAEATAWMLAQGRRGEWQC